MAPSLVRALTRGVRPREEEGGDPRRAAIVYPLVVSDREKRELQRQAAQGDTDAEARLLLARMRSGEISPAQVRAAAYLGDASARAALGEGAPEITIGAITWGWVQGLAEWGGDEALFRAALAASALVREVWERDNPGDVRYHRALQACHVWLRIPGDGMGRAAADLARELPKASPLSYAPNRAARAMRATGIWLDPGRRGGNEGLLEALQQAYRTSTPAALREAITNALLPWCLPP